jgi:XTP/dITP diphosphohydrolase
MTKKTPKKLLIATHNKGKLREIKAMLEPFGIEVISAAEAAIPDAIEDGDTFAANALLKARAGYTHSEIATLADDSGLSVDALGGKPGVFTARYGGYAKLLDEMAQITPEGRSAHFSCVLAYVDENGIETLFEGRTDGSISTNARQESDFGFDPVFIPTGDTRTYAEMPTSDKQKTSARARAFAKFIKHISG